MSHFEYDTVKAFIKKSKTVRDVITNVPKTVNEKRNGIFIH